MKKRKAWVILIVVVVLLLAGGGGYVAYTCLLTPDEASPEPTLQTAVVTRGDIVLTADGRGELVPAAELELGFRTGGEVAEVLVEVGDQVRQGDVLARLQTDELERALAEAEIELQIAQLELAEIQEGPSDAEMADAQAALRDAQVELVLAQDAYERTFGSNLDATADYLKIQFDWWVGYYQRQKAKYEEGHLSQADHDWAMAAMIAAEGRWKEAVNQALIEETQARNRLEQARAAVLEAEESLALLQSEPLTDTLAVATLAVDRALLEREKAADNLEAAQLYAPFDGTVMDISAAVGDQVSANGPVLALANLQEPLVLFWVEEADLGSVSVGNRVTVVFEGLPDDTFAGEVVRVSPVLVTVDGTSAVQAWASLDLEGTQVTLFSGMTAEVEIVAAETRDALLVPVEALQELLPGCYTVFVVKSDGALEERAVTVGLMDPVNVEVLSGLELGEVVSLGEAE